MLQWMLNHRSAPRAPAALDALGDATRRAIVERLSGGPATVTELAEPLSISRSAVLQHLTVLEGAALVRTEKVGRTRGCRLDPAGLEAVQAWAADHRQRWERRLDRLGELLAEEEG